jgi:phospholipid/cholesterol/gamma-HCH transport system substrate-binding protein
MANNTVETLIGAVVLAVAGGFLYYASASADFGGGGSYPLTAQFFKADGIGTGGDVRVSGVKVGTVDSVELDSETFQAKLTIAMRSDVKLPSDSSAKIASDGLLGGSYVSIEPGGSEYMLESGEAIEHTQGSVSLLDLIGKAVAGTN